MWQPLKVPKFAVAVYNWRGDVKSGLPLEIGDTVQILEENGGILEVIALPAWYRGFATKNRSAWGIFPSSILKIIPCYIKGTGINAIAEPNVDPLVREIACVLQEWTKLWKKLYVERETYRFDAVAKVIGELLSGRRTLLAGTLTQDQTRALRLKLVSKLDWGNRKLSLELVPRRGAEAVDPDDMSIVDLYKVHVESAERAANWRGTLRRAGGSGTFNTFNSNSLNPFNGGIPIVQSYQILCSLRDFGHSTGGDDVELFLWIHDAKKGQPLTDRFRIAISRDGFCDYVDRLHSNSTIFTDLSALETSRDLWLVAWATRRAKFGGGAVGVRRPLGAAVLSLNELLTEPPALHDTEHTFKLYQCEEKDFHQLPDMLIKKQTNKCTVLPGQPNYGIVLALRLMSNTQMSSAELSSGITLTPKRGFPDVIMPGDVRNDLYLTLEKGEFERGGKSTAKNVQVTVLVLDEKGNVIEDVVWGSSDSVADIYESVVMYHNNSPAWNDRLRLTVPIDVFTRAHLRLEYRHCSTRDKGEKKLYAFSYARLMEYSGATLRDGSHELYVYKCDDPSKLANASYLALPSCANDVARKNGDVYTPNFTRSSKESVVISTLLCSTKLTQNEELLALLQWRSHPEKVQETLVRVLRLGDDRDGLSCQELIKFLRDVLDALFALFSTDDGNSTQHSGTVFLVLVSIFSLLEETRFNNFKPVLDNYIEEHFSAALVYKGLVLSVQHCAEWAGGREGGEAIRKCLKSLGAVWRLAVRSRSLFALAAHGHFEDAWKRDVRAALAALTELAGLPSLEHVVQAQCALLQSWAEVCAVTAEAVGPAEAARAAGNLLAALPDPPGKADLAKAKLATIHQLVLGPLARNPESRNIIVTMACQHLRSHLMRHDELVLCGDILNDLVLLLWNTRHQGLEECEEELGVLCVNILDVLVETVLYLIGGNSTILGGLVCGLLGTVQCVSSQQHDKLWTKLRDRKPLKDYLMRALLLYRHLLDRDVFPPDWMVMRVASCRVLLTVLQDLAKPLLDKFLGDEPPQLDVQLWSGYLDLGVALVTSEALDENNNRTYGQMSPSEIRAAAAEQLLEMWATLGGGQRQLVGAGVGALLQAALVEGARGRALGALVKLMGSEGNRAHAALVDRLDALVAAHDADRHYKALLHTMLMERASCDEWRSAGASFVSCICRLLERLLDYRAVMQGHEHTYKRMACTVNLLNFYKNEIDRKEMYLRYVYKLHDLHIAVDNFVEAGCTLLLYGETLSWESDQLGVDPEHPDIPEWKRKETIYHQVIQYFDKGKCWEKGLPLLRELSTLYESRLCDIARLSKVLRTHANFLDSILHEMRPEPEYFRVGFYGKGCPLFVRNKQFVYRGLEYERIGAFTARLQTEYPAAQILMRNTPPDESIVAADGQYIQICNVKPVSSRKSWPPGAPEQLKKFYMVNEVNTFLCDRPVHKPPIDKDNEFKSLWIERTTLVTESPLPGTLRWSEVISRSVEEITPVEFACETMESTERELCSLIAQYTADPLKNINPFTMRLQGTIDANVQGGIRKYEQAFLSASFSRTADARAAGAASRLRCLIRSQLLVLDRALALHSRLAPADVKPLHRRLVERFNQMKQNLGADVTRSRRQMSESIINTPLPPVPHIEMRSSSYPHGDNFYDDGHFYNRPIYSCEDTDGDLTPILPSRSIDVRSPEVYSREWNDQPEGENDIAPPLPPRAAGTEKRNSFENPPIPRKTHKYSTVDISLEDSLNTEDHRDSGISSTSISMTDGVNHNCNIAYDEIRAQATYNKEDSDLNDIVTSVMSNSYKSVEVPPPIPPKSIIHLNSLDSSINQNDNNESELV